MIANPTKLAIPYIGWYHIHAIIIIVKIIGNDITKEPPNKIRNINPAAKLPKNGINENNQIIGYNKNIMLITLILIKYIPLKYMLQISF